MTTDQILQRLHPPESRQDVANFLLQISTQGFEMGALKLALRGDPDGWADSLSIEELINVFLVLKQYIVPIAARRAADYILKGKE